MKRHSYWMKWVFAVFCGAFFLLGLFTNVFRLGHYKEVPVVLRLLFIVIPIVIYVVVSNIYPDISVDDDHLYLYGSVLKTKYSFDLADIGPVIYLPVSLGMFIVNIRGSRQFSFFPIIVFGCFLMSSTISGFDEIKRAIRYEYPE